MSGYPRRLTTGFVVVLVVALVSCDSSEIANAPPPATPTSTGRSSITLSGLVFDHTSRGPLPAANVRLLVRATERSHDFFAVTTNAEGRYSLSGVPRGSISIAAAAGSGYYSPCPSGWGVVQADQVFDVHIVSATLLSTSGAPPDMPRNGGIWVSGVVFERTAEGRQPVAGATVHLGDGRSDPLVGSTTLTDAAGRYLVCPPIPSHGSDTYATVSVSREGYRPAGVRALLGWESDGVDIEISRD